MSMDPYRFILSSFANLYRNWDDAPFPCRNEKCAYESMARAATALPEQKVHLVSCLSPEEEESLLSSFRMTESLLKNQESGAYMEEKDGVSLLLNDSEHIAILSRREGNCIEACYRLAQACSKKLEAVHPFLRDEKLGYLTSSLAYLGEGLQAGFLCHFPLPMENEAATRKNLNDFGAKLEPLFGENAPGGLYRVCNLPFRETDAAAQLDMLTKVTKQLCEMEEDALNAKMEAERPSMLDAVGRAYGLLSHAYLLEKDEFLQNWSDLRIGALQKLLPISLKKADSLLPLGLSDKLLPEQRADRIRSQLKKGRNQSCLSSENSPHLPKKP